MKLSKTFTIVLTVVTLVLFSPFLNAQRLIVASAALNLDTVTITFVNLIEEGQFKTAAELFNTEIAKALPPQKLETTRNSLIGNVGEFKEIVETRTTEEKGC
jgi:hypothetical protein